MIPTGQKEPESTAEDIVSKPELTLFTWKGLKAELPQMVKDQFKDSSAEMRIKWNTTFKEVLDKIQNSSSGTFLAERTEAAAPGDEEKILTTPDFSVPPAPHNVQQVLGLETVDASDFVHTHTFRS